MQLTQEILEHSIGRVQQLLDEGADVNAIDPYGFTPLIEAAIANDEAIAKLLLERGAEVDLTDVTGRTALHWAVDNHNIPLCKLLLEKKANANAYTLGGQPVLVYPVLRNQQTLKRLLYRHGASLNVAQDYINAKLLGHRYHLLGQVDIATEKKSFIELDYEGFFLECTLEIIRNSLQRYQSNFGARSQRVYFDYLNEIINCFVVASELLKYQKYSIDIREHAKKINSLLDRDLLLLPIAYEGHAVTFIKCGSFLARCDRGENATREGSVVIYRISDSLILNRELLKWLIYKPQTREFITEEIKGALGLVPVAHLPLPPQTTGNCSWANVEAIIPTMLFLLLSITKKSPANQRKQEALDFYHHWVEWDQERALEECIYSFYRANEARKASKAATLGAILFQQCRHSDPKAIKRAEKIIPILMLPDYQYVLKSYIKIFWKQKKTDAGRNLIHLLDVCGVKI